ncbi:hypothetical protein FRC12_008201 [Ceratobasidium sp. 428]|nr:hypothetical protein FRC12_008201 [Ceratobasidium sp. 428]
MPMTASFSTSELGLGAYTPRPPSSSPLAASVRPTDPMPKIHFAPLPAPYQDVLDNGDNTETSCSSTYPESATSIAQRFPRGLRRLLGPSFRRLSSRESRGGKSLGRTFDGSISRWISSPSRTEFRSRPTTPDHGSHSASSSYLAPESSVNTQRPVRMLNGRVYGARRARQGLQPQPSMEPGFFKWGYSGMGGVGSSDEYSKDQSNLSAVDGGDSSNVDSGVTWIRKRRGKRERKVRERKSAEEGTEFNAEPRRSAKTTNLISATHPEQACSISVSQVSLNDTVSGHSFASSMPQNSIWLRTISLFSLRAPSIIALENADDMPSTLRNR